MTSALILAGKRDGALDPLAAAAGVSHKCVVPVAGVPMIQHVIEALAASPSIREIRVSIDDPALLDTIPLLRRLRQAGRLIAVRAERNLVDSILAATGGAAFPILITTADNVLLSPASIEEMIAGCDGADAAVAFARRSAVLTAHPDGQRRFYRFAEDGYSNCNSYWLRDAAALKLAETFRSGGQFAKHPMRIIGAFGLINLIRFRYGIGTLADAFGRFSRRFRLSIRPVILSDGATAIDVDNARTHGVAEELLVARSALAIAAE